ncbi:hypothetical protein, partial [Bacillus thuringiensis]|uniref:hypothetical protein n=1 Tax=Bacillus thuringiensis TaxID=1428 RepID=UPI001C92BE08
PSDQSKNQATTTQLPTPSHRTIKNTTITPTYFHTISKYTQSKTIHFNSKTYPINPYTQPKPHPTTPKTTP